MKVLHVINSLKTGGAEQLIVSGIQYYKSYGIQSDVLLINGSKTPLYNEFKAANAAQISHISKGSVYNPMHIFRLIAKIKNFDVVHVHLYPSFYWVALAKFLGNLKVQLVYTEHNTNNRRRKNSIYKLIDRFIYTRYIAIISISKEVESLLKQHLAGSSHNYYLIENGINVEKYANAKPYSKSDFFTDQDTILIQVASFRDAKDQQTLIKAMAILPANVKLLLVGDGPLRHSCEELAEKLNMQDRVKFLGIRMDVPRLISTADIMVHSAHWEGFGLAAVEGMAAGKPVVASDVGGLSNIVAGAGILFEPRNEHALAAHVNELIVNNAYYHSVSQMCLERSKLYSITEMTRKTVDVYKKITKF